MNAEHTAHMVERYATLNLYPFLPALVPEYTHSPAPFRTVLIHLHSSSFSTVLPFLSQSVIPCPTGLEEVEVRTVDELLAMIALGNANRTTHATESNDVSSRSHAICQITIRSPAPANAKPGADGAVPLGKLMMLT